MTVLSYYPYPELFGELASRIAFLLPRSGERILQDACQDIARWPRRTQVNKHLDLPLFDSQISVLTDDVTSTPQRSSAVPYSDRVLVSLPGSHSNVISLLGPILPSLWSIWECITLAEPVLVIGPSPEVVSGLTWWLREISRPIFFERDYRPYLTLQDQDYSLLIGKRPPKSNLLLGITNPLIQKTCLLWPNIIDIRVNGTESNAEWRASSHKRHTSKDRPLLKKLQSLFAAGVKLRIEGLYLLRQHFHIRSSEFLTPLNQYFNSLILPPSPQSGSSGMAPERVTKQFELSSFMAYLKQHGTPLPFRSLRQRNQFYERWIDSPNFASWINDREQEVRKAFGIFDP